MEEKKHSEADGEKIRSSMTIMGLNYVAAIVLAAFTFGQVDLEEKKDEHVVTEANVQLDPNEKEPPPPPPEEPPEVPITPEVPEEVIEKKNEETPPPPAVNPPAPPPPVAPKVEKVVAPVVEFPDVEAQFPGGPAEMMKWIQKNVEYPQTSIEMNEQGRVFLSFVVEADGSITNVKVERGISSDLDREAKRVVRSMPNWIPGENKGRKARVRCRIPIKFTLH